jgi:hypothetical protein
MGTPGSTPASLSPVDEAERRRRVRRSAILFAVLAASFYFGFIAMALVRGLR